MQFRTLFIILYLLLTGCATRPASLPSVPPAREHRLIVRPYLAASRVAQTLVATKTIEDINDLTVMPLIDPGDGQYHVISKATGEPLETFDSGRWTWGQVVYKARFMPWINFEQPVVFTGLKAHGRYRLQALAYDREGDLISQDDASSAVDLSLEDNDTIDSEIPLPLRLKDTPFGAGFHLTLSPTGAVTRLTGVFVTVERLGAESTPPQEVSFSYLSPFELQGPLQVSHLNASTRYIVRIEPQVSGDGPLPLSQSFEIQVGRDDALPDREVELPIPAL